MRMVSIPNVLMFINKQHFDYHTLIGKGYNMNMYYSFQVYTYCIMLVGCITTYFYVGCNESFR